VKGGLRHAFQQPPARVIVFHMRLEMPGHAHLRAAVIDSE
jgi:hypothetical protein